MAGPWGLAPQLGAGGLGVGWCREGLSDPVICSPSESMRLCPERPLPSRICTHPPLALEQEPGALVLTQFAGTRSPPSGGQSAPPPTGVSICHTLAMLENSDFLKKTSFNFENLN